jgi:zinc D-Ala-D-Ala carboxypeptidase
MRRFKKKKLICIAGIIVALVALAFLVWPGPKNPPSANQSISSNSKPRGQTFNKNLYTLDSASSIWVVVNKGRVLPSSFVPANLVVPNVSLRLNTSNPEMHVRADAAAAIEKMFAAAKQGDINLMLASGYRSYSEQVTLYASYVKISGTSGADTYSARPGHSEHQTGLAADIEPLSRTCEVEQCFENTPEGKWLAGNSYKFGFIIRYPQNGQNLTGYEYEPWHIRYIGNELSQQIHQTGLTLEQFFDLPVYKDYPAQSLILST